MEKGKIVFYTKQDGQGAFPFGKAEIAALQEAASGLELVFTGWDDERLMENAEGCVAAVAQNNHPLPPEFYERAKSLKWVHCMMSGVDKMRVKGSEYVTLTSTKGTHSVPLSEHVLAMMLCVSRGLHIARDNQSKKQWTRPPGICELHGATVGVVGLGMIGIEIARLLGNVGMRVIGADLGKPTAEKMKLIDEHYIFGELDGFFSQCDYVVLSVPLTEQTLHMVSEKQLCQMKNTAWLVNVARGNVIDEAALLKALTQGEIAGACLDVAAQEPRSEDDPLWQQENVLITPHMANVTPKKMERIVALLAENMRRFVLGQELMYIEN